MRYEKSIKRFLSLVEHLKITKTKTPVNKFFCKPVNSTCAAKQKPLRNLKHVSGQL